jgi:aryl-alcohol dehydrogenase
MKVRAAVHSEINSRLIIKELDLEAPRPDEVLIKTTTYGVCHTDIWVQQHYGNPMIFGQEARGIVARAGCDVESFSVGDHVVTAYTWCGECEACQEWRTWECDYFSENFSGLRPDGTTPFSLNGEPVTPLMREGGFSTYMICQKNSVIKVGPCLDLRILAPLGCGIMTGVGSVLNYIKPKAGHPVAVFGPGCVGLSAIMAARINNCELIIAVDRIGSRLELARELGATHCIDNGNTTQKTIKAIYNGGIGVSLMLNNHERMAGKTWETADTGFSVPPVFIPQLIAYYRAGNFPFEKMLRYYRFEKIEEAFTENRPRTAIKPVILMDDAPSIPPLSTGAH